VSAGIKLIKSFSFTQHDKSSGGEQLPLQSVFLTLTIPRTNLDQTEVKGVLSDTLLCPPRVSSISL